jgi:hypothetical protein
MNILLSGRHSGNTWLRYIISTVSEMMCVDDRLKNSIHELLYGTPKFPLTLSTLEKTVCKTHDLELISLNFKMDTSEVGSKPVSLGNGRMIERPRNLILEKLEENQVKLIFIIRDYAEVVFRGIDGLKDRYNRLSIDLKEKYWNSTLLPYINVLKQYDNYKGPKLLIRYEDLVANTSECSKEVLSFLNVFDETKHKDFCKNIDEHRRSCVNLYTVTQENESFTRGDPTKIKFHNNSTESELDLPNVTKALKEIAGDTIFNKYFTNKAIT